MIIMGQIEYLVSTYKHGSLSLDEICELYSMEMEMAMLALLTGCKPTGMTLDNACYNGNIELIQLMISIGAEIGKHSLHRACVHGVSEMIQLIVAVDSKSIRPKPLSLSDSDSIDGIIASLYIGMNYTEYNDCALNNVSFKRLIELL